MKVDKNKKEIEEIKTRNCLYLSNYFYDWFCIVGLKHKQFLDLEGKI